MKAPPAEHGFSLIEALVALAILAVASAGLVRAAEAHVDTIRGLEDRAAAQWIAENRLVELAIGDRAAAADTVQMIGRDWRVAVVTRPTDDADLARVTVSVSAIGARAPLLTLDGFADRRTTTP